MELEQEVDRPPHATRLRSQEHPVISLDEQLHLLTTTSPDILWLADAHGNVVYVSDRWREYTGFSASSALGEQWVAALHPDEAETVSQAWRAALAAHAVYEIEHRMRRHDGEFRWFISRASPMRDAEGKAIRWAGSATEVHERKLAAQALQEEAQLTEHLFQLSKALASELDLSKLVQIITDVGTETTGAHFGAFFYNVAAPGQDSYMLYAISGVPKETFEHFPMPRATAIFGPTFRGEGAIRLGDVRKDPRFGQNAPYHGMPTGHLPVVSYLAVPVVSRTGEVWGGLFFGHPQQDVFTERHERIVTGIAAQAAAAMDTSRTYQAEQQARAAAEMANKAKDRFLAMLSHELRTPLTPVLMLASALEVAPELAEDVRPHIATIRRNVELEVKLIDDLLDLSRIVSGKLALNVEAVNFNIKVANVIEMCRPIAEDKGVLIHFDPAPALPVIAADSARVQQIIWNLLNNAIKFTSQGGKVIVMTSQAQADSVQLQIHDTGVGIAEEDLPQLFNAFEQGGQHVTRTYGGLGLGLAITKALVEAHHGTIAAESAGLGKGAVFTVVLPAGAAEIRHPVPVVVSHGPSEAVQARMLLVEDHEDTARTLGALLRRRGYQVDVASTQADAIALFDRNAYDILVSDLGLPDGSGYDLLGKIRRKSQIPAVAMSGFGMQEDIEKSLAAGFSEHLTKPVKIAVLERAIARLLAPASY